MPSIDFDDLVKEYYQEVKDQYPNISFAKFDNICRSPFYYVKQQMEKGVTIILIKYLGKMRMFTSTIKKLMKRNQYRIDRGLITTDQFTERDENYKRIIKEIELEESLDTTLTIIDDETD